MKIYTKSGDKGFTSLTGGQRVGKNDPHVVAYGTVDEANSMIGLALAELSNASNRSVDKAKDMLIQVQKDLFHVGAELSTPMGKDVYWPVKEEHVTRLEQFIDELEQDLTPLQQFILPGGSKAGALLHLARTIIRRSERESILLQDELSSTFVLAYLNRTSDFLFMAARWINHTQGTPESPFIP